MISHILQEISSHSSRQPFVIYTATLATLGVISPLLASSTSIKVKAFITIEYAKNKNKYPQCGRKEFFSESEVSGP